METSGEIREDANDKLTRISIIAYAKLRQTPAEFARKMVMRFEQKIILGTLVGVLSLVPVIGTSLSLKKIVTEQNQLISLNAREVILAERLRYVNANANRLVPIFVLNNNPLQLVKIDDERKIFKSIIDELLRIETNPSQQTLISEIQKISDDLRKMSEPGFQMRRHGGSIEAVHEYFVAKAAPLTGKLNRAMDQLVDEESEDMRVAKEQATSLTSQIVNAAFVLALIALGLLGAGGSIVFFAIKERKDHDSQQLLKFEQEKRVSKARKEAVEVVAHDLKNPLTSILVCLDILSRRHENPSVNLDEVLTMMAQSTGSMNSLITEVLDHTKIESGKIHIALQENDLAQIMKHLEELFSPIAQSKNVQLRFESRFQTATICCDKIRFEQAVANLISNAIKFTRAQGSVSILTHEKPGTLTISVKDSGPGISAEQIPYLFERYWQARESAAQGSGLGLAIVKSIIEGHGGQIEVVSEVGCGSEFKITLPLTEKA